MTDTTFSNNQIVAVPELVCFFSKIFMIAKIRLLGDFFNQK